eukprot:scaffold7066_cov253-Pinguiococcus_pyrenoidosus.AAC.41
MDATGAPADADEATRGASRDPPSRRPNATAERYKRLLGLARTGLEETTKQLQERERQLQALQVALNPRGFARTKLLRMIPYPVDRSGKAAGER